MSESDKNSFDLNRLKIDHDLKKPSSFRWISILIVIFLFMAILIGLFYWSNNRVEKVQITEVQQVSNQQGAILNASGYVTPRQRATVAAKVTGRISE
jgi:flagellar basal body-associated protein FliL